MKIIIYLGLTIFLLSCEKDDKRIILQTSNYELSDLGRIPYGFEFQSFLEEENTHAIEIRTRNIRKNDAIESIDSFAEGKNIYKFVFLAYHKYASNKLTWDYPAKMDIKNWITLASSWQMSEGIYLFVKPVARNGIKLCSRRKAGVGKNMSFLKSIF